MFTSARMFTAGYNASGTMLWVESDGTNVPYPDNQLVGTGARFGTGNDAIVCTESGVRDIHYRLALIGPVQATTRIVVDGVALPDSVDAALTPKEVFEGHARTEVVAGARVSVQIRGLDHIPVQLSVGRSAWLRIEPAAVPAQTARSRRRAHAR